MLEIMNLVPVASYIPPSPLLLISNNRYGGSPGFIQPTTLVLQCLIQRGSLAIELHPSMY